MPHAGAGRQGPRALATAAIGDLIEQELGNLPPFDTPLATILTMTEVDPADPAFGRGAAP
jgi:carbamate kinase